MLSLQCNRQSDDDAENEDGSHELPPIAPSAWAASVLARRERWPHAALITGPAGIGKRALADWLARVLLCETPRADGAPCNACPGCHYVGAGQHPDLRIVDAFERSDDDVKAVEWIVVDRIRALLQWAELTSHRGGAKVAISE